MKKRTFTEKNNAKKFMAKLKKDGRIGIMNEVIYTRKFENGEWIKYHKYEVEYE